MSKENQMQNNTVLVINSYINKYIIKEWGAICIYAEQFISKKGTKTGNGVNKRYLTL